MTVSANKPLNEETLIPAAFNRKRYRRVALAVTGVAVVAVVAAGAVVVNNVEHSNSSVNQTSYADGAADYAVAPESSASLESSSKADMTTADSSNIVEGERSTIVSGNLNLTVDSPSEISNQIVTVVTGAGGRIDSAQKQPGNEYQPDTASLTVRIPSDKYAETLKALEAFGTVTYSNVDLYDVEDQVAQNDIRTESLRTSIARLQGMLAAAQNTADLITIETELQNREVELEMLVASSDSLTDQVDYATVQVQLTSEEESVKPDPETFGSGFITGWESLVGFGAAILVGVGIIIPWTLAFGAIGTIAYFILKLRKKRRVTTVVKSETDLE